MTTHRIRKGEGQGGVLLRCLIEALVENNAIKVEKWEAVRLAYMTKVNASPEGARHPDVYFRHVGEICKDLDPNISITSGDPKALTLPAAVAAPEAPVAPPMTDSERDLAEIGLTINDIGLDVPIEENPFTKAGGPLEKALDEWSTKKAFPFFQVIVIDGKKYVVVGNARATAKDGTIINIDASYGNIRGTLAKADDKVHVFWGGRQVVMARDTKNPTKGSEETYFVRLLHYRPGHEIRMWLNRKPADGPRADMRTARARMDNSAVGFTMQTTKPASPAPNPKLVN